MNSKRINNIYMPRNDATYKDAFLKVYKKMRIQI